MLTKKDYEAIAKAIRDGERDNTGPAATALQIAEDIAVYCEQDNPRFDRDRFLDAALPWTREES